MYRLIRVVKHIHVSIHEQGPGRYPTVKRIEHVWIAARGFVRQFWQIQVGKLWRLISGRGHETIAIGLIEHMGDIVAAEPVCRQVRGRHPDAHIIWFARDPYMELLASNSVIDQSLSVSCLTQWMLLRESGLFQGVYDLHLPGRICPTCQVPLEKREGNQEITTSNYYRHGTLLAIACQNAALSIIDEGPHLSIPERVSKKVSGIGLPDTFIAVHCRANESTRDWTEQKWGELARRVSADLAIPIVEIGSDGVLGGEVGIRNLCGKLSILETAEVIRKAEVFIGVDSGPAHLANAAGTFGILLLGRYRAFDRYLPYSGRYGDGSNAILLFSDGPAAEISVDQVFRSVVKRISQKMLTKSPDVWLQSLPSGRH